MFIIHRESEALSVANHEIVRLKADYYMQEEKPFHNPAEWC